MSKQQTPEINIQGEDYRVFFQVEDNTLYCEGHWRLSQQDYMNVMRAFDTLKKTPPDSLTLNLCKLDFINSSGMAMLMQFIASMKQTTPMDISILGNKDNPWHKKSLRNIPRLFPDLRLSLI